MMKKYILFLLLTFSLFWKGIAQEPDLPLKSVLNTTLHNDVVFDSGTNVDTLMVPYKDEAFTIEIKANVNTATGRGLDFELRDALGLGLRTSINKTSFDLTSDLSNFENLSVSVDNGQEQTYRYAVKDGMVHIYQDGHYLASENLVSLNTQDAAAIAYGSNNELGLWAGYTNDNSGKPSDYGWENPQVVDIFNTANASGGIRYMDVVSGHNLESDGSAYNGRLMYIRWDGNSYSNSVYAFPVNLEEDTYYRFSWLYELLANANAGVSMSVALSSNPDGTGVLVSKEFTTGNAFQLRNGDFSFISQVSGTHYLTISGDWALFGIGELQLESSNLINTWKGLSENPMGTPAEYGWANTYSSVNWQTANSNSGVRYMDVSSGHTLDSNNSLYDGRVLYMKWDEAVYENTVYSFPVSLKSDTSYNLTFLYELIENGDSGAGITVSVAPSSYGSAALVSKMFSTGDPYHLKKGELVFNVSADGIYYITIIGDPALFGLAQLSLQERSASGIIIGKNYADGAVDLNISAITYEDQAYAPEKITVAPSMEIAMDEMEKSVNAFSRSKVVLSNSTSLYLKSPYSPLINSLVEFNSIDGRLIFENIAPAKVIASYLSQITVNGALAINGSNVAVTAYGAGTAIAAHSSDFMPLRVFTEENYAGDSQDYKIVIPYTDLGSFDNNIKSFTLKKGYMATFASNKDGTGYSKVFIANDKDLEVPVIEAYLNGTVSFIRTMRWNDVTKKGWCGSGNPITEVRATNSTWRYNWDTGSETLPDVEYVPMRHNLYWPGFGPANTKEGYTHFLGYNEPDRPDQANISVEQAISGWPAFMQSGLRLGSPSTSDPFNSWLGDFMTQAEENNYRVDYMALHCYWYKSASSWANDLKNIYERYKRPLWITEWNIGANWTGNSFQDDPNMLTDANANKHKNDLVAVLEVLDNADYVERYSIYNWVQDARAMIVTIDPSFKERNPNYENYEWLKDAPIISSWEDGANGTIKMVLTPAGEYYANNASKKAYNPDLEYNSTWTPKVESLSYELAFTNDKIEVKWTGNNYDLVSKYILERRLEGETTFSVFYESEDYSLLSVDDIVHSQAEYRLKVVGKDGVESAYSPIVTFIQQIPTEAPSNLQGEALSSSIIKLSWSEVENAESYNLKRSSTQDGTYEVIAEYLTETSYEDIDLTENTSFFYKVSTSNTGGESPDSESLEVKTLSIHKPDSVNNILIGSGDGKVKLEWDLMYDAQFYVKRSPIETGTFTILATISENQYIDETVVNGEHYYYKIIAFNEVGETETPEVLMASPGLGQHVYYDFEEDSGTIALDIWGNYTGTLMTGVTRSEGQTGAAVNLAGNATSYIQLRDGIVEDMDDFTVSTWINLTSLSHWMRIFDFGWNTSSWMALEAADGDNKIRYEIDNAGAKSVLTSDYTLPTNQWLHVAVVVEGQIGKIYVDASEVASGPITIKPSDLGKTPANYLGKSQYNDPYLNGMLDEFKIFNRALSASEIYEMYLGVQHTSELKTNYLFHTYENVLFAYNKGFTEAKYYLYDISGRLIKSGALETNGTTNLGHYPTGIYIVKVMDDKGYQTSKVVVGR